MNTDLRRKKSNWEKDVFKMINNVVLGKTIENVWKHRDIKLVKTKGRRNYLLSELNYYTLTEHLLAIEVKETLLLTNRPVYLEL